MLKAASKHPVLADVAVGLLAGLAATHLTNLAQRPLKWVTPDSVEWREKLVRPGASSSLVAAKKVTRDGGVAPSRQQVESLGTAIHFGIGIAWGPVYGLLRRYVGLRPFGAALTSGVAMSLILDEGLVPVLGLSASNRHYPAFTRLRGLLAHLVYGAAVGSCAHFLTIAHLWLVSGVLNSVSNNSADLLNHIDDPHAPPPSNAPAGENPA